MVINLIDWKQTGYINKKNNKSFAYSISALTRQV